MTDNDVLDMDALEQRIHDALASKLAETLGQVKAVRQVAQEIAGVERDIRRHRALAAQIESSVIADNDEESSHELAREQKRLERLDTIRQALLTDLNDLASALEQP